MPFPALLIIAASAGALIFALLLQYGFQVLPCQLCLWQRGPFALLIVLGVAAAVVRPYGRFTVSVFWVCALLLLANAGIAVFHSGVERHWWEFHSSCTGGALEKLDSLEAMRLQLLATPVVRCDEIAWSLFGLSMANFNVVYSLMLAMVAAVAGFRLRGCRPQ